MRFFCISAGFKTQIGFNCSSLSIYQISNEVQKAKVSKNTKSLIGLAPWGRGIEYWGKIPKVNHWSTGKRMEGISRFWIKEMRWTKVIKKRNRSRSGCDC